MLCATLVLDSSGSDLVEHISNKVYESCRAGTLPVPTFPQFEPTLQALRENAAARNAVRTYKVCLQQGSHLKVLESFAEKWVSTELTKDRAVSIIEDHNMQYNPDSDWWACDKSPV